MTQITEQNIWQDHMKRTLAGLCLWGKPGDRFDYCPDNRDLFVRARLGWGEPDHERLLLQIPRSPAMADYYSAIRDFFQSRNMEWKDRTVEGQRFMTVTVPKDATVLEDLVQGFGREVFDCEQMQRINNEYSVWLGLRCSLSSRPGLFFAVSFVFMVSFLLLAALEIMGLFDLSLPSFTNLSGLEIRLMGIGALAMLIGRGLRHQRVLAVETRRRTGRHIRYMWFLLIALCLFTA